MRHLAHRTFVSLATAALAVLFAQSAWAMTPVSAAGSFFFTHPPTVTLLHSSEGNTLIRLDFPSAVVTGDIAGTFAESLLIKTHPTGEQNVSGLATCACAVGGQSGTLFFDFVGTGTAGGGSHAQFVLSGDGGLAGLHGTGTAMVSRGFMGTYTAEYHFGP